MKSAQLWGFHLQKPHNPKNGRKMAIFAVKNFWGSRRFQSDSSIYFDSSESNLSKYMLESLWKRLVKAVEGEQKERLYYNLKMPVFGPFLHFFQKAHFYFSLSMGA